MFTLYSESEQLAKVKQLYDNYNYRVKKWIADYEEILASGFDEERDKLIYARRLMDGTTKKMLLTVSAANCKARLGQPLRYI